MKVDAGRIKDFEALLNSSAVIRLLLWLIPSLVLSLVFFREFWVSLPTILSPDWVFGQHHATSWGVLLLCLIFIVLKRKEVWRHMRLRVTPAFIVAGAALVVVAVLMRASQEYLVFQVLLASLGVFIILFGRGPKIPFILLTIYGFAISFPLVIGRFAENAYSQTAIVPVMGLISALDYPFQSQGQLVHFMTAGGEPISVAITSACAGPATMGVFIAIFALMMLDTPLSPRKAGAMFLFGVAGTWLQSIIRLIIVLLVGYYLGKDTLWTAHFWTIYGLFPLWYLLFAYVYFRQVGKPPELGRQQKLKNVPATGR